MTRAKPPDPPDFSDLPLFEIRSDAYNGMPPIAPGTGAGGTSARAAWSILPTAGSIRRLVLDFIRKRESYGATDEEIQERLGLSHNTARPRRRELALGGWITASGERDTQSGRKATVWIAAKDRSG